MDLNKEAVAAAVARGATEASSAKELAAASDIVMLCLTTSAVVEKLVYADDGILAGIKEGAVLIDFGTSIPSTTHKIGADLAKKGAGVDRQQLFDIMSTGPSSSPFMQFCKNYAVDGVSDLGFSIANANKDLGYFVKMVEDLGTRAQIAEGTSANLQAAFDAGMGAGNVPEILDYFLKLEK
jgi:3-hydroxyisobutyrate dehydrogenase-like beta-hydroxyacid dehydrogenase